MTFYTGDAFPAWRGNLFIGAMGLTHLGRYVFRGDTLVREERIFDGMPWRVRAVAQGPDGLLYLGVDAGMVLRLRPADPAPKQQPRSKDKQQPRGKDKQQPRMNANEREYNNNCKAVACCCGYSR
jgi:hypothetical protein